MQGSLDSQIQSHGMQQALSMPMQQLNFMQNYAQVNQGLATQAMQNRQALLGMGSQIKQQEQNFRAGTASSTTSQSQGGGMGGALTGGLAGLGVGLGAASMFGGMGPKKAFDQQGTGPTVDKMN